MRAQLVAYALAAVFYVDAGRRTLQLARIIGAGEPSPGRALAVVLAWPLFAWRGRARP